MTGTTLHAHHRLRLTVDAGHRIGELAVRHLAACGRFYRSDRMTEDTGAVTCQACIEGTEERTKC